MAGLVPAMHVLHPGAEQEVDARHEAGHDGGGFLFGHFSDQSQHELDVLHGGTRRTLAEIVEAGH
jgi:hypothetical protein